MGQGFFNRKPVSVICCRRVVEMRGVEPLSENTSAGLSPSAFRDLFFTDQPSAEGLLTV